MFSKGTHFNPIAFLEAIHRLNDLYGTLSDDGVLEVPMDLASFASMLDGRKRVEAGADGKTKIFFKLYSHLVCSPPCGEMIEIINGDKYLRIDCLSDA